MSTSSVTNKVKAVDPLREFLDAVVSRIEALETHCGISTTPPTFLSTSSSHGMQKTPSARHIPGAGETPSNKAYDKFYNATVFTLADTCDDLGMGEMGKLVTEVFAGIRYVVVLASKSKMPDELGELAQYLTPITGPVGEIRKLRLARDFDSHQKAILEMLVSVSWVTCRPPNQLPAPFVKECIGSSDFWSNRIRKDYKGKDDDTAKLQLAFCDNVKKVLEGLVSYIEEYHKTGLEFNPKGISLAEAAIRMTDNPLQDAAIEANRKKDQQSHKKAQDLGTTVKGANMAGLVSELANRVNDDGSSAATGLRKVTKDQQTWRKEFKGGDKAKPKPVIIPPPSPKKQIKKKKVGLPVLEYQERGTKWVIENHDSETVKAMSDSGFLTVEITDPKQQVYIFNCEDVTVKVTGAKLKSLIVDTCTKVNVIFPTIISGCEIVNSKKVAVQSDGVCPVFTIDKTVGVTVYLSAESAAVSSFTTSMSSEMNVSIPDGDDQRELPIPEQFVHKLVNGTLTSEVSDLYH